MEREHYYWIDNIKIFACLLVLLGHLFMSLTAPIDFSKGELYQWFIQTIYYFHVPLFFLCSGFLYQKFSKVDSLTSWKSNVMKKAVALGVPYFTFSFATWLLKVVFSASVHNAANGLARSLFIDPISPYWFLYCLFLIFLITPTFKNVKVASIAVCVAILMKTMSILGLGGSVYFVKIVLINEIWFVLGMMVVFIPIKRLKKSIGVILITLFLVLSVLTRMRGWNNEFISFAIALLAIIGFLCVFSNWNRTNTVLLFFSKYTMSIFLMHTLCAATVRVILLKLGIVSWIAHTAVGIVTSIIGPVVVTQIMHKTYWLEFFINPWKMLNGRRHV